MIQQIASYIVLVMSTIVTVLNKLLEYQAIYYSTKNRMNGDGIDIHSGFFFIYRYSAIQLYKNIFDN